MQDSATGSVSGFAFRETYASIPWVNASTPTCAVRGLGIENVSSQSTMATVGMSFASRIIIFTLREVSVITATFVASLPVPAVVGTATNGGPGFETRWYP